MTYILPKIISECILNAIEYVLGKIIYFSYFFLFIRLYYEFEINFFISFLHFISMKHVLRYVLDGRHKIS